MRMCATALLTLVIGAVAGGPGNVQAADALPQESQQVDAWLDAEQARFYRDTAQRYDAAVQAAPANVDLAIARCVFIAAFLDEESGRWQEDAVADSEACTQDLEARFGEAPATQLHLFRQTWDETAITRGEALLESAKAWPVALRRELHVELASRYRDDNTARAGEVALVAAQLGDAGSIAAAAKHLATTGDQAAAADLLRNAAPVEYDWQLAKRLEAALLLEDPTVADALVSSVDASQLGTYSAVPRARILLRNGDAAAALVALEDAWSGGAALGVRFDAALRAERFEVAAAQVKFDGADAFAPAMQRLVQLLRVAPQTLAQPPILLAFGLLLLTMLALCAAPALLLLPVHYRGLVRRTRGRVATPLFAWAGLRGAWLGLGVTLVMPLVAAIVFVPDAVGLLLGEENAAPARMFPVLLASTLIGLVVLSPFLWRALRDVRGTLSIPRQIGLGLLALLPLYAAAFVQGLYNFWRSVDMNTEQAQMVDGLVNATGAAGGPLLAFALIAMLVPVLEELVFRGLLLGGMARHISFGWANTLQALLFAAVHADPPRFAFYLALGLLAGYMARRTRSLLPAIVLHVACNTIAFAILSR